MIPENKCLHAYAYTYMHAFKNACAHTHTHTPIQKNILTGDTQAG